MCTACMCVFVWAIPAVLDNMHCLSPSSPKPFKNITVGPFTSTTSHPNGGGSPVCHPPFAWQLPWWPSLHHGDSSGKLTGRVARGKQHFGMRERWRRPGRGDIGGGANKRVEGLLRGDVMGAAQVHEEAKEVRKPVTQRRGRQRTRRQNQTERLSVNVCVCVYVLWSSTEAKEKYPPPPHFSEICSFSTQGKWTSNVKVCPFSVNTNLENYFRKAIIHPTSPQVQFQNLVPLTRRTPGENIALALFTVCSFRETITIWARRGEEEEE